MRPIVLLLAALFFTAAACADDTPASASAATPVPNSAEHKIIVTDDTGKEIFIDDLEPEVTITPKEGGTEITEYKIRGRVYLVKVQPKNAPAYYLVDPDGDGDFNNIGGDISDPIQAPMWVIKTW